MAALSRAAGPETCSLAGPDNTVTREVGETGEDEEEDGGGGGHTNDGGFSRVVYLVFFSVSFS